MTSKFSPFACYVQLRLHPIAFAESIICILNLWSVFQDSGEFDEMSEEFRNRLGLVPVMILL